MQVVKVKAQKPGSINLKRISLESGNTHKCFLNKWLSGIKWQETTSKQVQTIRRVVIGIWEVQGVGAVKNDWETESGE